MSAREFTSRADYVSVIPEAVERTLAQDPLSDLYYVTSFNISGGHEYWGDQATAVYEKPATLEEGLLALELRSVLETAAINQLAKLRRLASEPDVSLKSWGIPMRFGGYSETPEKLGVRSPGASLMWKIEASRITRRISNLGISDFLYQYCYRRCIDESEVCAKY